ncbi:MAG: hypothetical protein HY078_08010 [Elusimicrobia bacterium]|nr:hypothetical protein [Elusimicrobiota bacterium]
MTSTPYCALGVLRELTNSPNRETDDALILSAVMSELERLGVKTDLLTPEEFDACDPAAWDLILPMCESYPRLRRLEGLDGLRGPMLVNRPGAVLNCYRTRMVPLLSRDARVVFPASVIRSVEDGPGAPPEEFPAPDGWWIKRGDVHNTCSHDVVRIRRWSEVGPVLSEFQSREITHVVIQPHIDGDLIKFYGVGPGRWSTWFYHDPGQIRGLPFETDELASMAGAAAEAMGLEVFGGDAIVSAGRRITVIDINSWPSFAKVRGGAAPQIARHLCARLMPSQSPVERAGRHAT